MRLNQLLARKKADKGKGKAVVPGDASAATISKGKGKSKATSVPATPVKTAKGPKTRSKSTKKRLATDIADKRGERRKRKLRILPLPLVRCIPLPARGRPSIRSCTRPRLTGRRSIAVKIVTSSMTFSPV